MAKRKKPDELELDSEDVELIMGEDIEKLTFLLQNAFCAHCTKRTTTVTNYRIFLNDLDDLIFRGECIRCQKPVARYIETGENKEYAAIARHIRRVREDFL